MRSNSLSLGGQDWKAAIRDRGQLKALAKTVIGLQVRTSISSAQSDVVEEFSQNFFNLKFQNLPRLQKSLAVTFPIPVLHPVIIAVFPYKRAVLVHLGAQNVVISLKEFLCMTCHIQKNKTN